MVAWRHGRQQGVPRAAIQSGGRYSRRQRTRFAARRVQQFGHDPGRPHRHRRLDGTQRLRASRSREARITMARGHRLPTDARLCLDVLRAVSGLKRKMRLETFIGRLRLAVEPVLSFPAV
jgi:hypothetical protein